VDDRRGSRVRRDRRSGPLFVGSPTQIVDQIEEMMKVTGVDGFNLMYTVMPECFVDFVDLVIPEMQSRGIYKSDYAPGTLRQKLLSRGREQHIRIRARNTEFVRRFRPSDGLRRLKKCSRTIGSQHNWKEWR
jgi:hypothetical protein